MEYRILGPLEVLDEGRSIDVGPKQQRDLLGLLLLNAHRVVSTERILEELWGEEAHGKENTLWVYISRLRSALEPEREARSSSKLLVTKDHGYSLLVDSDDVDSHQFENAVEIGRSLLKDDPSAAAEQLRIGLDLWRGQALEDFAYEDFAQSEITRLEELRLSAIEDRMEADLRSGRHREISGELDAFAQANPLRERPVALLLKTLYRSGRQADALRAFERYRRVVGDELGIEPSPELCRLEEQVLLHDPRLEGLVSPSPATTEIVGERNPFMGLQAFSEADAERFFGRDRLISELVRRLTQGDRLLALVGASGSGKSSVLRAGLIPAVRKGAVDRDSWLIAQMVPGSRPFTELEAGLLRSTPDAPDSLSELLEDGSDGLLRAALRVLPDRSARLLLVVDQFEELFTLVDSESVRTRFIHNLEVALDDPHGRIVIVLALRADFYDRPLEYAHFGELLGGGVVNTVPLTPDELETAAEEPAAFAGVRLEPSLLTRLLIDVTGQSGGLPLFQYALTELFDRRVEGILTAEAYKDLHGVQGAITRRAEDLFLKLSQTEQEAAKQLFLRLVTIADSDEWTRRRVHASEIVNLGVDVVAMQTVLDSFGTYRLLTFDRDNATGSPTVEVAHEALMHEWVRLRDWIDEGRDDVAHHARLTGAFVEWKAFGENPDYLLSGERLDHYEEWTRISTLHLSTDEQRFVDASIAHREELHEIEDERVARESRLGRQSRQRLWGLAAAVATLVMLGTGVLVATLGGDLPQVAMVHSGAGDLGMNDLMIEGLATAEREFDIQVAQVVPLVDPEGELRSLAETGTDLIIVSTSYDRFVEPIALEFPEVRFVGLDPFALHADYDNVSEILFAVEESGFLAGVAAAMTTNTEIVAFIGAVPTPQVEAARTGFEEGVRFHDSDVQVLSRYIGPVENPMATAGAKPNLARDLATQLYGEGADVIFAVAGESGTGVIDAAVALSEPSRHLWVIGSDIDQHGSVSAVEGAHVLSSAVKRFDTAVAISISSFLDETLTPGSATLGLDEDGVALSRTGGHLDDVSGQLANLEGDIAFGHIRVPKYPLRNPGWQIQPDIVWQLTIEGKRCFVTNGPKVSAGGLVAVTPGDIVELEYANRTGEIAGLAFRTIPPGTSLAQLEEQALEGIPTSFDAILGATRVASGATTSLAMVMPNTRVVANCFLDPLETLPGDFMAMILTPAP